MTTSSIALKAGTRSSNLALTQTKRLLDSLGEMLPDIEFALTEISSPGDRDQSIDLRDSPTDFFTRDLDDALLKGDVDCAIHSAKDMPDPMPEGIDWCWLPWSEDPRDAILLAKGKTLEDLSEAPSCGISSDRRDDYCKKRFPKAILKSIRGNIEERIEQLDAGDYDLIIMASAALNRLDLSDRISELIPVQDLDVPEGQGYLGMTFRADDERFIKIRSLLVKSVMFVGGSVGSADLCTVAGVKALERCEVCLHDSLLDQALLAHVPSNATLIDVGKRCGEHRKKQDQITELLSFYARQGKRVVRLKGGDPGIFGRLAEEVEELDRLRLPYKVIPGISSASVATTGTGMLLTRRGVSRGFSIMTPRKQGGGLADVTSSKRADLPLVFFMAAKAVEEVSKQLLDDGTGSDTPAAIVSGAGTDTERITASTLGEIAKDLAEADEQTRAMPGIFIVGEIARYRFQNNGALAGMSILLTCSEALQEKARTAVVDLGGKPISRPLIKLVPTDNAVSRMKHINTYNWIILTSPSSVRCMMELLQDSAVDMREIPRIIVCGSGTADELIKHNLYPDIVPDNDFSASSVIEMAKGVLDKDAKVLRLRSDKAGEDLAKSLEKTGANIDDCVLYSNETILYDSLPEFDTVFFASASSVEVFVKSWGKEALKGKLITAIGNPTVKALNDNGLDAGIVSPKATVEASITAIAVEQIRNDIL